VKSLLLAGGVFFALVGCAAPDADRPAAADPNAGLAFGRFDATDSEVAVTHVVLIRISPTKMYMGGSGERATVSYSDGRFYSPNLSPGLYAVNGFYSGNQPFGLQGNLRGNTFQVEPGGIAYAGTYKIRYQRKGLFERDVAAFERIDSRPSETQLLRWLAEEPGAAAWAARLRQRLSRLSSTSMTTEIAP
jgi:hypothetical protein